MNIGWGMFESIVLKFTEDPKTLRIDGRGITIFVGPNNSGKSLALRELEIQCQSPSKIGDLKILEDFQIIWPTKADLDKHETVNKSRRPDGMAIDHVYIGRFSPFGGFEGQSIMRNVLEQQLLQKTNKFWVSSQFLKFFSIKLDGRTRFELTNDKPQGDLSANVPANSLANIFSDDELRRKIRSVIFDAIGLHFVIDPTNGGMLRIRLSGEAPIHDEQSLNSVAREFHKAATYIKDASDGVQAYVGIVTAVYAGEFSAILIDEPEAFLHPPLARKLGFTLASAAAEEGKCLLASTHSPDFLIGCLQASESVRVVRLEYSNGKSKGRLVSSDELSKIYKSPLMRSANVFSALFYDGVIVTESDNDRAFYQEIYHRIVEFDKSMPSVLFINAQNKQTIKDIIGPLRNFGMPAAAITDIDIIKDGGKVWSGWMNSAQIPEALRDGFASQRDAINNAFSKASLDMKRDGGVFSLRDGDKMAAQYLFKAISDYGIFVVNSGELEAWLPELGVAGRKTEWVISILERMGSDPSAGGYVKPTSDGVWDFIRGICAWIANPSRCGTA